MDTLQYKGFTGSICYWPETSSLHGEVLDIDEQLMYEGEDLGELTIAFEAVIDEKLKKEWKEEAHKVNNEYFLESVKKHHKLMESFSYKGYKGTAKISLEDDSLYGKILYIPNLVMYSSNTVKGLREQFEHSVDWYIEHISTTFGEITNEFNASFNEEATK